MSLAAVAFADAVEADPDAAATCHKRAAYVAAEAAWLDAYNVAAEAAPLVEEAQP